MDSSNSREIKQLQQQLDRLSASMADQAKDQVDSVADQAKQYVDQASTAAKQYAGQAADYMQDKAGKAKEKALQAGRKAHGYATENPWQVAGMALAAGVIIGMVMSRNRD